MLYCSKCRSETNGCREEQPDAPCDVTGAIAGTETSATTETSGSMSSTSVDPVTTTEPTMTMSTTDSMDSSTTEDIEPGCGNGVWEEELQENCDMDDVPAQECEDVGLTGEGPVSCYPSGHPLECRYDLTECEGASQCGNQIIEGAEQCDGDNLNKETCETLSDSYIGGELSCTDPPGGCTFNTSACDLCLMNSTPCEVSAQCCTGLVCNIITHRCAAI